MPQRKSPSAWRAIPKYFEEESIMPHSASESKGKIPNLPIWHVDLHALDSSPRYQSMTGFERGTYLQMLKCEFASKGKGLPGPGAGSKLRRMLSLTVEEWALVAPAILECFYEKGGRLYNERCENEIKKAIKNKNTAVRRGKKGAKVRWEKNALSIEQACLNYGSTSSSTSSSGKDGNILPSSPSSGDAKRGKSGEVEEVDFRDMIWEKEEDAIYCARRTIQARDRTSIFMARLIVRNALDCWQKREGPRKLRNPNSVFQKRARQGRATLLRSGDHFDDRAAAVVKEWLEAGVL
jgi:uncharacterized protein YdaU (DUF1376 family)